MDRVHLTGIYVLHPLFGINTSADILLACYVKPRVIILVRFQSLAEFHISVATATLSRKTSMVLQFTVIVTLTELSRPFSGDPFSLHPRIFSQSSKRISYRLFSMKKKRESSTTFGTLI